MTFTNCVSMYAKKLNATIAANIAAMASTPADLPKKSMFTEYASLTDSAANGESFSSSDIAPSMKMLLNTPAEYVPGKNKVTYCTALGKVETGI